MKRFITIPLMIALGAILGACDTMMTQPSDEYGMVLSRQERYGYRGTEGASDRYERQRPRRKRLANERNRRPDNITQRPTEKPRQDDGIVRPKQKNNDPAPPEITEPEITEPEEKVVKKPDPLIESKPPDPKPKSEPKTVKKDYPLASPVPGKAGVVFSPYVSGKKVSVEGFKPGEVAECPWSGKPFRVP